MYESKKKANENSLAKTSGGGTGIEKKKNFGKSALIDSGIRDKRIEMTGACSPFVVKTNSRDTF